MFSKAVKGVGLVGSAALLLTGCADLTADQSFYHDEEDNLVYDFAYNVNITHDDADILIGASSQTAGLIDGAQSREDICDSMFAAMRGEESVPGSERVLPFGEEGIISESELQYVETEYGERSSSMDCTLTLKSVPVGESSMDGLLGGIDVWHDEEEGIIYAVLDGEAEQDDTWIDRFETIENNDEVNSRVFSNADFIFEFPGDVMSFDNGSLINQRNYDGSIDRTRLVNQDIGSANILHITAEEMVDNNGFQIAAGDDDMASWMQWLIYGASGLLIFVAVWMVLLFVRRQRKEKKRKSPARRALSDVHEITLDNPNPYKEDRGIVAISKNKKKKRALKERAKEQKEVAPAPVRKNPSAPKQAAKPAPKPKRAPMNTSPANTEKKTSGLGAALAPAVRRGGISEAPKKTEEPPVWATYKEEEKAASERKAARSSLPVSADLVKESAVEPREFEGDEPEIKGKSKWAPKPKSEPSTQAVSSDYFGEDTEVEDNADESDLDNEEQGRSKGSNADSEIEISSDMFFNDDEDDESEDSSR